MNKHDMICYNSDASRLIGSVSSVVCPKSVKDVQNIVKTSNNLVPRGGGSNLIGGCVPSKSTVVDLCHLNKVSKFDSKNKTVYVEAGTTLKELNEKLKSVGFEFPIVMREFSTIGGMVAVNCISERRGYGTMKDWIEEAEFINGRGELVRISKADLADVCGMEGITGIIVKVKLRIIPLVKRSISVFQSDSLDEVFSIARRLKLEKQVIMLKVLSSEVSRMLDFPEKYNLIIEFDSNRGKIRGREYEDILKLIKKENYFLYSKEYYNYEDPKLFFDKLKEFILFLEEERIPYSSDLGAGSVKAFYKDSDAVKKIKILGFLKKVKIKFSSGIGLSRKDFIDSFEKKIIQRVKLRHDPFLKINPGKIIDLDDKKFESEDKRKEIKVEVVKEPKSSEDKDSVNIIPGKDVQVSENEEIGELAEEFKTPEEKMNEFVKKVEQGNGVKPINNIEPKEISQVRVSSHDTLREGSNQDNEEETDDFVLRGKVTDEEKDIINKIMFNKSDNEEGDKKDKESDVKND